MSDRESAESAADICPRMDFLPPQPTQPAAAPIYLSAVYRCTDPNQADQILAGAEPGYVYSRDGHPNADLLAEKCRQLHAAQQARICGSGMAALAAASLALLQQGDHVVASNGLYGKSLALLNKELARLGVDCSVVDTGDLQAVQAALRPTTRLLLVETISNPQLRVADIGGLAELTAPRGICLLVDNTFAGPTVFRPLEWGANLVMESLTKIMNGHSDVLLGLLCGGGPTFERIPAVLSTYGFTAHPFDCWLAARGLGTLALRADRASDNALQVARFLAEHPGVEQVLYPGLADHPDHPLAKRQFGDRFGSMVSFTLAGDVAAATAFIQRATMIPFCPSLGDLGTTLSHPVSTSHRGLSAEARRAIGISGGMIRLSVGIESADHIVSALMTALAE